MFSLDSVCCSPAQIVNSLFWNEKWKKYFIPALPEAPFVFFISVTFEKLNKIWDETRADFTCGVLKNSKGAREHFTRIREKFRIICNSGRKFLRRLEIFYGKNNGKKKRNEHNGSVDCEKLIIWEYCLRKFLLGIVDRFFDSPSRLGLIILWHTICQYRKRHPSPGQLALLRPSSLVPCQLSVCK